VPIREKDHQGVPVSPTVALGCLDEPVDLLGGQVLPRAQVAVWTPPWCNCSFYGGWPHQPQAWFRHRNRPCLMITIGTKVNIRTVRSQTAVEQVAQKRLVWQRRVPYRGGLRGGFQFEVDFKSRSKALSQAASPDSALVAEEPKAYRTRGLPREKDG
jgi:hypothetical protein